MPDWKHIHEEAARNEGAGEEEPIKSNYPIPKKNQTYSTHTAFNNSQNCLYYFIIEKSKCKKY